MTKTLDCNDLQVFAPPSFEIVAPTDEVLAESGIRPIEFLKQCDRVLPLLRSEAGVEAVFVACAAAIANEALKGSSRGDDESDYIDEILEELRDRAEAICEANREAFVPLYRECATAGSA